MRIVLTCVLLLAALSLAATLIQIGSGTVANQGLPMEPFLNFSYSQQLYRASEINTSGAITSIGFQYHVVSSNFIESSREIKVYMGTSPRERMDSWVSPDSLCLVYDGVLNLDNFSAVLPGDGWLTIPLQIPFYYDGSSNLVIAYDENSITCSLTSDEFLCSNATQTMGILYKSSAVNPDPLSPPTENCYYRNARSNLRLSITQVQHIPISPYPAEGALDIPVTNLNLQWYSDATAFDVYLGTNANALELIANHISPCQYTLPQTLAMNQSYYWKVVGFIGTEAYPSDLWHFNSAGEQQSAPRNLYGSLNNDHVSLTWQSPLEGSLAEYRVYRNNVLLSNCLSENYQDYAINAGITYYYEVRALNLAGQLSPPSNSITIYIPEVIPNLILQDSFEAYNSFAAPMNPWQSLDLDNSVTWEWETLDFPGEGAAMAWMVIDPTQTVPAMPSISPVHGAKMLMVMSSYYPPNNDWLISPRMNLGNNPLLTFSARSYTSAYGAERLKVLISTTDNTPASFIEISTSPYLAVPAAWTDYQIDLSAYQNQHVYLAFQCVSWDAFALFLDNVIVTGAGGSVPVEDDLIAPVSYKIYPNPAQSHFRVTSNSKTAFDLAIYDLRGRKLENLRAISEYDSRIQGLKLSPGIYFVRLFQDGRSETRKIVIIN